MTGLREWFSLFAATGHLSLAVTALLGGGRSALARPLAALCFTLFGWNFATLGRLALGAPSFSVLDAVFTALGPPLVLEVVLVFIGQARRHRTVRLAAWTLFGTVAIASAAGFVSAAARAWVDAPSWAAVFLAGWAPTAVFEAVVLVRHLARSVDTREKARARTVLAALAIGTATTMSDVVHGLGVPMPYLGALGTLISAALLTTLAVRLELFDRNVSSRTVIYLVGMVAAFVVAYLAVFRAFARDLAALVFGTAAMTLLVAAVVRELTGALAQARERKNRLAVLGRFSAQMAHDLKSPVTALLGAVQVLDGIAPDGASTRDAETRRELLGLVGEQARRVAAIVERYDRLGRVEPHKTLVRIHEIVRAVARAHEIDPSALSLAPGEPECEADAALLESAVDNVVKNAVEAAGAARVRIETEEDRVAASVVVRVVDRGHGMDSRTLERALDDFFTTKAAGSGFGLPFARRVLLAHGGDLSLSSERGGGTVVELRLPSLRADA